MTFSMHLPSIQPGPARFTYPSHVIAPTMDQAELYDAFIAAAGSAAFLDGINVNIMAYGQTGSGKTHTVFGLPGIMARRPAARTATAPAPSTASSRALLQIFDACEKMRAAGSALVLTASAVELAWRATSTCSPAARRPTWPQALGRAGTGRGPASQSTG